MSEATVADDAPPELAEMSKIGSERWKALDDASRKEWNKKGQKKREEDDYGQTESLICAKCKKTFTRQKEFNYHSKNCVLCTCDICQKEFSNKISLRKHRKIHDNIITCALCEKSFSSQQALKRHTHSVHETQTYACDVCTKKFSTHGNLKRHEKIHSK
ncbi:zinc finger protein 18-like [Hydractinia symbiolongicarpus]|uniref:zinc finger protein 18-like n=1 Tax=Hydractinia symbiolongicarpus TaxID=13093 RepID=UPI00254E84C7|nr:zinc finger protein 18-like [Hydractinia symbiolongicarpus]XP_057310300.1 zinc finger protein 18-like [Hydractinia symbiolongicarpus]